MLDIIKTICICNTFDLTLVYFFSTKAYEVQFSNQDDIIGTDGAYSTKQEGLKAFTRYKKTLIKEGKQ